MVIHIIYIIYIYISQLYKGKYVTKIIQGNLQTKSGIEGRNLNRLWS